MGKRPEYVNIGGERHKLVVVRIEERDTQGRPRTGLFGIDETASFRLSEDPQYNHFMTVYVPCKMLVPKPPGDSDDHRGNPQETG